MRVRGVKGGVLGKGVPGNRCLQCVSCDSHGVNLLRSSPSIHVRRGFPDPDKERERMVSSSQRRETPPVTVQQVQQVVATANNRLHAHCAGTPTTHAHQIRTLANTIHPQCRNSTERPTSIAERIPSFLAHASPAPHHPWSTAQSSDSAPSQQPTHVLAIVGQATMWGRGIGSTHVICKILPSPYIRFAARVAWQSISPHG